jgi:hypothetical protein
LNTDLSVPDHARCGQCGYALRGLSEARCPECGTAFSVQEVSKPYLPRWPRLMSYLLVGMALNATFMFAHMLRYCLEHHPTLGLRALLNWSQQIVLIILGPIATIGLYRSRRSGWILSVILLVSLCSLSLGTTLLYPGLGVWNSAIPRELIQHFLLFLILLIYLITGRRWKTLSGRTLVISEIGFKQRVIGRTDWLLLMVIVVLHISLNKASNIYTVYASPPPPMRFPIPSSVGRPMSPPILPGQVALPLLSQIRYFRYELFTMIIGLTSIVWLWLRLGSVRLITALLLISITGINAFQFRGFLHPPPRWIMQARWPWIDFCLFAFWPKFETSVPLFAIFLFAIFGLPRSEINRYQLH